MDWIKTSQRMPPQNLVVETKIDDENGCRNQQNLYLCRNLWFLEDGSMYVYYVPTHWRYLN